MCRRDIKLVYLIVLEKCLNFNNFFKTGEK